MLGIKSLNGNKLDTWFTSNSGTTTAKGRYHEWQTDTLAAAAENIQIEGDQLDASVITPTVRAGNYTQILAKIFMVSDTQEKVDKAGRTSEIAYQTTKTLKELARDIEYGLLINSASAVGASATARKTKGVIGWIATNATTAATGTGTAALTETVMNDNLALIWAQGGTPKVSLVGAITKRAISAFTTNTKYTLADEKKLTSAVDIYQSDFGPIAIKLHHIINTTAPGTMVNLGDMELWKKAWLNNVKKEEMARTGLARKFVVHCELALECRQEKGSGKITQLTAA